MKTMIPSIAVLNLCCKCCPFDYFLMHKTETGPICVNIQPDCVGSEHQRESIPAVAAATAGAADKAADYFENSDK